MFSARWLDDTVTIRYDRLPTQWAEGFPLGNGGLGVMVWSDGRRLHFTLDSAAAWDLRIEPEQPNYEQMSYAKLRRWVAGGDFAAIDAAARKVLTWHPIRPTKLYLGRLELSTEFEPQCELALFLAEGLVQGTVHSGIGRHSLQAFVCRDRDLFCLRLEPWPKNASLNLVPFYEASPDLAELGHPELEVFERDGLMVAVQHILPDLVWALCWNHTGPHIFISYADGDDVDTVVNDVLRMHPHHDAAAFARLLKTHREGWADFWSASDLALPEPDIELLWRLGIYILAGCTRAGENPPGLQGLWAMDGRVPPWRGDYHADMNVQETFWSACPTNHIELLDVWLDFQHDLLPAVESVTRKVFGTPGTFWWCSFLPRYTPVLGSGWHPTAFAWSHTGWLAHLAWLRWRYSMDTQWLARRGYPIVSSAFEFYSANLEEGEDGCLHIPLSSSPEYDGPAPTAWCADPNIDIALIRGCCDWITQMEAALEIDRLSARAREIRERLVPYHLVEFKHPAAYVRSAAPAGTRVLALWKDKPLDYSHRHPSHLMAIHPVMDITIDGSEEEREIIEASLRHYLALGQYCWAGHTYVQMVSLAAIVGEGGMAYNFLCHYRDHWTLPNGLHVNREISRTGDSHFGGVARQRVSELAPFTIEAMCGISCGISDMLVQGWGDCLRIFPAIPSCWRDLLFVNLRTEGAFLVSALMREGRVRWVRIAATVDGTCRLRNPFGNDEFEVAGGEPLREDGLLQWPMRAGQVITLWTSGYRSPDLAREAEEIRALPGPDPTL